MQYSVPYCVSMSWKSCCVWRTASARVQSTANTTALRLWFSGNDGISVAQSHSSSSQRLGANGGPSSENMSVPVLCGGLGATKRCPRKRRTSVVLPEPRAPHTKTL